MISSLDSVNVFPLYLYPVPSAQQTIEPAVKRLPNLNVEIVNQMAEKLGLTFVPEKSLSFGGVGEITFSPIDILDYIYAVLHSPTYRDKYKEFLKIDFPRVPYPSGRDMACMVSTFWQLVKLGGEIRQVHLMESPILENYITQYPVNGNNLVEKVIASPSPSKGGEFVDVYINGNQYFADVPGSSWDFYIGGYQPAQKWLKDRKGRKLEFDEIMHYQKIIVALSETERLMNEIDQIEIE